MNIYEKSFSKGSCEIIKKDCCSLNSSDFLQKVNNVVKVILEENNINNINNINIYYVMCICMSGHSQQYAVLLLYSFLKNNIFDKKFVKDELENIKTEIPVWAKVLFQSYICNDLHEYIGVKAIKKTKYGLVHITRNIQNTETEKILYKQKNYWKSQFNLIKVY